MKALALALLAALAACFPGPTDTLTRASADPSVYQVFTEAHMGTAWVAAPGYLVTAGHVCADGLGAAPMWAKDTSDRYTPVRPVVWEESSDAFHDACILGALGPVGEPLPILAAPPAVGAEDFIVAYPGGDHTTSGGHYLGGLSTSAYADHGSSGGPVMTADGVYMIVVQGHPDGSPGCLGTSGAEILALLAEATNGR